MHPSISDQSPSDQRLRSCKLQPTPPAPTAEQCIDRLKERMNARGDRFRSCSTRLRLVSLRPTTAPQMETQRDVGRRRGPDRRQARRSHQCTSAEADDYGADSGPRVSDRGDHKEVSQRARARPRSEGVEPASHTCVGTCSRGRA
jgi:hypothetical protein